MARKTTVLLGKTVQIQDFGCCERMGGGQNYLSITASPYSAII